MALKEGFNKGDPFRYNSNRIVYGDDDELSRQGFRKSPESMNRHERVTFEIREYCVVFNYTLLVREDNGLYSTVDRSLRFEVPLEIFRDPSTRTMPELLKDYARRKSKPVSKEKKEKDLITEELMEMRYRETSIPKLNT